MKRETRYDIKGISKKSKWCKMILSIVLTAAMVVGNLGGQIKSVLAYDYSDAVVFDLTSRDVYYAIQDAVENGVSLTTDDINFTNGKINKYRNLFYGEAKKADERISTVEDEAAFRIVEFFPEYEADMETELRGFVCLPLDSDENYQLTGSEPVILLYINNSGETMKYFVEMDGRKKNSAVVKSYEEAFGEDEVEIISPDFNTEVESSSAELEATEGIQESTDESESTQTAEDETVQTTEESQAEDVTEESTSESKDETDTEGETEAKDEADTEDETEEKEEPDTEDETELEVLEPQAAITRHYAPMVAVALEDDGFQEKASEAIMTEGDKTESEITSSEAEVEVDDEMTSAAEESEETTETAVETEEVKESLTEAGTETETEEVNESAVETKESGEAESEIQEETVQPSSAPVEETEVSVNDKTESEESGSIAEGKYPLVGIDFCCTAKAYVTNIHNLGVDLDAIDDGFFWQQEMADGVIVTLKADDMAARELTSDVSASIQDISEAAREAIALNVGVSAQDVIAYDISLLDAEGNVIDNESWQGQVAVSFSGSRIEELSSANDGLAVIHEASEVDGTASDITAEQLEIEVLSIVEAEGAKTVDEVSGSTVGFSILGTVPKTMNGELEHELGWMDAGWAGGTSDDLQNHGYYLTIEGMPVFCVSPNANYPEPIDKKNLDNPLNFDFFQSEYEETDLKSMIGKDVIPHANFKYTRDKLLWASIIIQLGYPRDAAGMCEVKYGKQDKPNTITFKMYHSTQDAEYAVLMDTIPVEEFARELYDEAWKILDANNNNKPIHIASSDKIVFEYKENGDNSSYWITNEFSIDTSEDTYILDISEEITVELKRGDQWNKLNESELKSIPKDSVLRMRSENEPDTGALYVSVVRQKLVLDESKCRFFVPKDDKLQTLMTLENEEISEDARVELSYSVNKPDTDPTPTPTPTPDPTPSGGGSGGGGSSTVPSGRYTPETGGPGEAVTLIDGDVPLAALPPQPMEQISILDDEVPLAALPKTGDRTGAHGAMFIFSGLLLAVYSLLSKKEKERL